MVNFNLPGPSQLSITMVDPSGKIVISNIKMSIGSCSRLNISELKSGIYFVQVFGKNNQLLFTDKLIKE
jgi:hypothetical protein